jgi:EAL domain-containing protein (putative c-di-GMP-specific phosphodiesterase class I)
MGCRFALDDFGTGMSSFAYLKYLPVDYLKIAGMFIKDMETDPMDHAIVDSVNRIGHILGMQTVAESVEDAATLARLKEMGVDYAQGYFISEPEALGAETGHERTSLSA